MEYHEGESAYFANWKLELELARTVHDDHRASGGRLFEATIQFGLEAIRTAALINGGAVIAIIAFLGATYSTRGEVETIRHALWGPAFIFISGSILCGIAAGCAYVSQALFTEAHSRVALQWKRPFVQDNADKAYVENWAKVFQGMAVGWVVFAYAALITGVVMLWLVIPT
ncbi:hypothetical protein NN6n1_35900 [Shinella zoogloeoides]